MTVVGRDRVGGRRRGLGRLRRIQLRGLFGDPAFHLGQLFLQGLGVAAVLLQGLRLREKSVGLALQGPERLLEVADLVATLGELSRQFLTLLEQHVLPPGRIFDRDLRLVRLLVVSLVLERGGDDGGRRLFLFGGELLIDGDADGGRLRAGARDHQHQEADEGPHRADEHGEKRKERHSAGRAANRSTTHAALSEASAETTRTDGVG